MVKFLKNIFKRKRVGRLILNDEEQIIGILPK